MNTSNDVACVRCGRSFGMHSWATREVCNMFVEPTTRREADNSGGVEAAFREGYYEGHSDGGIYRSESEAWEASAAFAALKEQEAPVLAERERCARIVETSPMRFAGQTEETVRATLAAAIRQPTGEPK